VDDDDDGDDGGELELLLLDGDDGGDWELELLGDGILGEEGDDEDEDDGIDGMLLDDVLELLWQLIRLRPRPPTTTALATACTKRCFFMSLFPVI